MSLTVMVSVSTSDIEAGLHFYRDRLGFAETIRTPNVGIAAKRS